MLGHRAVIDPRRDLGIPAIGFTVSSTRRVWTKLIRGLALIANHLSIFVT